MENPKTTIRKYGDRRLYDSTASRYVKLEDIKSMVRNGVEVTVTDARTGEDLTRLILTQIIVEEARSEESGPPLQLLRQIVMASDRATHEFLTWYLNNTMELYHKAQDAFQSRLSDAKTVVTSPIDFVRRLLAGQQVPPARDPEIEELRRKVEDLEARLAGARAAKPRKRKPPRTRAARSA